MLTVIPVSSHDADRLPWLVDVLIHLQGLQAHELLLFSTPSVIDRAHTQVDRLKAVCPKVEVAAMDIEPSWGWPTSPNLQWYSTVMHLHNSGHRSGFFWMEIDCVPLVTEWANLLANEYMSKGRPFCGRVVNTPFRNAQGGIMATPAGDTMMMGCAIYPPAMPRDIEIAPLLLDVGKAPPYHAEQPWDVYLRWVMKRRGVAHSDLVADMWSTCNYRYDGVNGLVCDPAPVDERLRGRALGGAVPAGSALVHGCKDRSLYDLVLNNSTTIKAGWNPPQPVALPLPEPPKVKTGVEKMVEAWEECRPLVASTGEEKTTPVEPLPDNSSPPPAPSDEGPIGAIETVFTRKLRTTIEKWEGATNVKRLADKLEVTQEEIRAALPATGYVIRGPAGWVGKPAELVEV